MSNDFAAGAGSAFDAAMKNNGDGSSRRKRNVDLASAMEQTMSFVLKRPKRQSNEMDNMNVNIDDNKSAVDRIKAMFNTVVDAAKEMIQKVREATGFNNNNQGPTNAETAEQLEKFFYVHLQRRFFLHIFFV